MEKIRRQEKANSLLKKVISVFIRSEIRSKAVITVTRIESEDDFRTAVIFVSVFPESEEEAVMVLLKRSLSDLRDYVKLKVKMGALPFFSFSIDRGLKMERRIEELLK